MCCRCCRCFESSSHVCARMRAYMYIRLCFYLYGNNGNTLAWTPTPTGWMLLPFSVLQRQHPRLSSLRRGHDGRLKLLLPVDGNTPKTTEQK